MEHRWYAIQTTAGHENKVRSLIARKIELDARAPEERPIRQALVPTQEVVEIKNGKKTRLLKNCTYAGITPEFWNSCDAIGNPKHWKLWGTPNCGKGEPMQVMGTGHGAAPARFRNVRVGVFR